MNGKEMAHRRYSSHILCFQWLTGSVFLNTDNWLHYWLYLWVSLGHIAMLTTDQSGVFNKMSPF